MDFPGSDPSVVSVGGTKLLAGSDGRYQGETVWNEVASGYGAGGGGLSTVFSLPGYESGPGVQNAYSNGNREVPDVSANADPRPPTLYIAPSSTRAMAQDGLVSVARARRRRSGPA